VTWTCRPAKARRLADEPITLEELADEFGVSRERVRQIEVRAFEKVQKAVKRHIAALQVRQDRGAAEQMAILPNPDRALQLRGISQ
jgi:orotate phosphoribosyltransferase-like protein